MASRSILKRISQPIAPRSAVRLYPSCLSSFQTRLNSSIPPPGTPPPPPPPASDPTPPRPRDLRSQFASARPDSSSPSSTSTQPTPKRSLRPYIYATFFLVVGMTVGQYMRLVVSPPALPAAYSREDVLMTDFIHKEGEKLPIVKSLTEDPLWEWHDAYETLSFEERQVRFTTGALAGARALGGFQRIFTNKSTGELIAVVWFGGAVAGWPGVTHGGLVATVLDELCGRCAVRQFPSQTGVTANLEINYRKPIMTNSYYVLRAIPQKETFTEKKGWIEARLETLEGKICAEGKALFVVPKKYQTVRFAGKF